jgi:hypothetical protein
MKALGLPAKTERTWVWVLPLFFTVLAFFLRIPLIQVRADVLPGDETVLGIMAKNILEGHFPIFYYGQSYMGALEAYIIALLGLGMGVNGWTVQLGAFFSYGLFLIVHFFLIRRLFGLLASISSALLLCVSPPLFWELSVRALGGYTEVLFFGSLSFLFWLKVFSDREKKYHFPLGLSLGLGLWVNPLFLLYLFPLIGMTLYWKYGFKKRAPWLQPIRLFFLKDFKAPFWLKLPFLCLHAFFLIYFLHQILLFALGDFKFLGVGFDFSAAPFRWKGVKKIFLLIGLESVLLFYITQGRKALVSFLKNSAGIVGGFLLGYLPSMAYSLAGGEGHRILQGSAAIRADEILDRLKWIYLGILPARVFGIPLSLDPAFFMESVLGLFVLLFFLSALVFYFFSFRKDWRYFFRLKRGVQSEGFFFCFLALSVLFVVLLSTLEADRYLVPFYWASVVAAGFFLKRIHSLSKGMFYTLLTILVSYYFFADVHYVLTYPKQDDVQGLLRILEKEDLRGGVTDYDNAYRLSFYSQEKFKFMPLQGIVRIAKYQGHVDSLTRKAFIFADPEHEKQFREENPEFIPKEIKTFKNFLIYVTD